MDIISKNRAAALIAALAMCMTTACGSVEESASAAVSTAAEAAVSQTESAPAETTQAETVSEASESPEAETVKETTAKTVTEAAPSPLPDAGGFLNESNCIVNIDVESEYSKEKVYAMAELAVNQYNAAALGDKQAYFDTVSIPALLRTEMKKYSPKNRENNLTFAEEELFVGALLFTDEEIYKEYSEQLDMTLEEIKNEENVKKANKVFNEIADKVTVDTAGMLFDESMSFAHFEKYYKDLTADPSTLTLSADDGALYYVDLLDYAERDYGTFARIDISVYRGEYKITLEDSCVWLADTENGVYIEHMDIEKNPCKEMTLDEIRKDAEALTEQER